MRGHTVFFKQFHQMIGHAIVDGTLASNASFFETVKSGGIVFIVHKHQIGVIGGVYFLGFTFIHLLSFHHGIVLLLLFEIRIKRSKQHFWQVLLLFVLF